MTYCLLLIVYCLMFAFIAWHRFNFALALFFFLLPAYLIRFNIGPLPTTLLEMMFIIIFFIWTIKHISSRLRTVRLFGRTPAQGGGPLLKAGRNTYHVALDTIKRNRLFFTGIILFLTASTISIFVSSNLKAALGEWKAFYIEPVIMFLILITTFKESRSKIKNLKSEIIFALTLSGLLTSIIAIYQHFTGWMVPWDFWQNNETFRVTAWYGFPNAVGLFLAPIWPLAFYLLKEKINIFFKNKEIKKYFLLYVIPCILYLVLSPLAIFYAKSTGALIGLMAGIGILLLSYKKTRWPVIIIAIVGISGLLSISSLSSLRNEVTLQDRSGQIRLSMWSDTIEFLKDNPITGAGLASYGEKITPYHTTVNDEGIEIFHHPHNIFLTMWVNLGLLGLVSFILILIWFFKTALLRNMLRNKPTIFLLSSMVIIITMGLVDSPYIKNDLAIFFWLLPALLLNVTKTFRFD